MSRPTRNRRPPERGTNSMLITSLDGSHEKQSYVPVRDRTIVTLVPRVTPNTGTAGAETRQSASIANEPIQINQCTNNIRDANPLTIGMGRLSMSDENKGDEEEHVTAVHAIPESNATLTDNPKEPVVDENADHNTTPASPHHNNNIPSTSCNNDISREDTPRSEFSGPIISEWKAAVGLSYPVRIRAQGNPAINTPRTGLGLADGPGPLFIQSTSPENESISNEDLCASRQYEDVYGQDSTGDTDYIDWPRAETFVIPEPEEANPAHNNDSVSSVAVLEALDTDISKVKALVSKLRADCSGFRHFMWGRMIDDVSNQIQILRTCDAINGHCLPDLDVIINWVSDGQCSKGTWNNTFRFITAAKLAYSTLSDARQAAIYDPTGTLVQQLSEWHKPYSAIANDLEHSVFRAPLQYRIKLENFKLQVEPWVAKRKAK